MRRSITLLVATLLIAFGLGGCGNSAFTYKSPTSAAANGFLVPNLPNLIITNVSLAVGGIGVGAGESLYTGDLVTLNISVKNTGTPTFQGYIGMVTFNPVSNVNLPGNFLIFNIPSLNFLEEEVIRVTFVPTAISADAFFGFTVELDVNNDLDEITKADNSFTTAPPHYPVIIGSRPNLVPLSVNTTPVAANNAPNTFAFTVVAQNTGGSDAGPFTARVTLSGGTNISFLVAFPLGIPAGASATSAPTTVSVQPPGSYTVNVELNNNPRLIQESNYADNTLTPPPVISFSSGGVPNNNN